MLPSIHSIVSVSVRLPLPFALALPLVPLAVPALALPLPLLLSLVLAILFAADRRSDLSQASCAVTVACKKMVFRKLFDCFSRMPANFSIFTEIKIIMATGVGKNFLS